MGEVCTGLNERGRMEWRGDERMNGFEKLFVHRGMKEREGGSDPEIEEMG